MTLTFRNGVWFYFNKTRLYSVVFLLLENGDHKKDQTV